jgi:hypothetical protein
MASLVFFVRRWAIEKYDSLPTNCKKYRQKPSRIILIGLINSQAEHLYASKSGVTLPILQCGNKDAWPEQAMVAGSNAIV